MKTFRTLKTSTVWFKLMLTMLLSWYPFMCLHELGHIASALLTGGEIEKIILVPWKISQTVIKDSNHPLVDVWAGPIAGVAIPLVGLLTLTATKRKNYYLSVFTGFCLIANGIYIGIGWVDRIGDAGDILSTGGNIASMVFFGLATVVGGLFIWHRALENDAE